jgi:hypothetical protein
LLSSRLVAALFAILLALALPQAVGAQPILIGKALVARQSAPSLWQPVRSVFVAPGQSALQISWGGVAAARTGAPIVSIGRPSRPLSAPAVELPAPAMPWLSLLLP